MANRGKNRSNRKRRPSRRRRHVKLTWVNLLLFWPVLLLMFVSMISFAAITVYRHPTPWHIFGVVLIIAILVLVVRARSQEES